MSYYTGKDHTFAVCAYGNSIYLRECIESLLNQSVKSNILISTSTPDDYITGLANEYGIDVRINENAPSIAGDWNFAYKQAETKLITLAHQDDIYLPDYLSTALEMVNKAKRPVIFFSHYAEIANDKIVYSNSRLNIKKLMLIPVKIFKQSRFIRRRVLSFGSPVCCPSVMYVNLKNMTFSDEFSAALDWHKWEELSKFKGSFVYCGKPLVYHRLHTDTETAKAVSDGIRRQEDYLMFRKFWCAPVAKVLTGFYAKSEKGSDGST